MTVEDIESSILGTKEYWDTVYARDLTNFRDFGDAGENWFGDLCVRTIVNWVKNNYDDLECEIADIGCGNGHILFELEELGYRRMVGMDYSEAAIDLCKESASHESLIEFKVSDLTNNAQIESSAKLYTLIIDKGTFDAMSLSPAADADKSQRDEKIIETYARNVSKMLKDDNGRLLITSCNWTVDELTRYFASHFQFVTEVKGRKSAFQFGGVSGSTERMVVFAKKTRAV